MFKRFTAETRWSVFACLFVLGLITAIVVLPFKFSTAAAGQNGLFTRTESHDPGLPNFDIRTAKDEKAPAFFDAARNSVGKSAVSVADIRDGFVRGEDALRSKLPQVKFEYNEDIRIPEVITPDVWKSKVEWLSSPSGDKRADILRSFVKDNNDLIGVNDQQADGLIVTADYTNPDGNMSFAHLEQRINGVPVFRGEVKAGFTKDGRIIRVINNLAPGMDYGSLSTEFGDPANAVRSAAGYINHDIRPSNVARNDAASNDLKVVFGQGDWATTAEKMYFPTEPGVAVPSWRVLIWEPVNAYYVIVDASTGTMLWRKNITEDQTQSATYNVYNNVNAFMRAADSPAALSPGPLDPTLGTQAPLGTRTNVTLIGNEGPLSFNNNGWITDGGNTTDGNANEAGIDRDGTNGVDAPQVGAPNRTFTSTWNPPPGSPAPGDDPLTAQAQRGAVIQMFYVMNRYHDSMYQRGFTEQAFNFQADNFGRGGLGVDRVSSEGQDSSGTNNANFSTPADGGRGRMQMFVWTGPTPDYDGTADAEVILHEVTHGTSNRLHGNASGLSTNMARGMGEGWSDFYAEAMLSEPTDPINGIYTTGGYATFLVAAGFTGNYYYGIRRFPRAPITFLGANGKPHNPFTFKYINAGCNTLIGTTTSNPPPNSAFPRGPIGVTTCDQVHNIGEIWSSMLWEVRNRMVTRLGHTAGTTRVLQVVTDGMKLAPIGPTIIQERDAIIAAAAALPLAPEASLDVADVREGFRVRGAGFSSAVTNAGTGADNTIVVEAFDTPNVVMTNPFSVNDSTGNNNGVPEPGENVRLSVAVTNTTGATVNSVVVNVDGGANVSYGNVADGATVTNLIPYTVSAAAPCGSTVSVTINISSAAGAQTPQVRSFALGTPSGVVQNFDGVTAPALPAGWTTTQDSGTAITWTTTATGPSSAPNSAFANDPATVNMSSLESPVIPITSAAAQIKFKNKYVTESGFDGMVLEIKIGAGAYADFITAGGSWVSGGYNAPISASFGSPIAGRQAWTGTSAGGYIDTVGNLPPAANGQSVSFRWRMASDSSLAATGVNIDDVQVVSSFTCQPVTPTSKKPFDFDGDGKTDISVFRPNAGSPQWWVLKSTGGNFATQFGAAGDVMTPADYTGDGKADVAFFRPSNGNWFILRSEDLTFFAFPFGTNGDTPAPGDYDGDNKVDAAVFRPSNSTWFISKSSGGTTITAFGAAGDVPINNDYDGDGKNDIAIYRPNAGNPQWWIQRSTAGLIAFQFGAAGDKTVAGDYTGDGKADVAFFRPSTGFWYVLRSEDSSFYAFPFGNNTDTPAPGDYDGDGKNDAAVFRPSSNTWYINRTGGAGVLIQPFGAAGDIAIPSAYVR
ncbi:MAG: M36 family metallopeptidase [Pyrinomonadaceae bacterium]|nr:M36 family metallopeptidase [Pyrinomonadaceae bacterium]MBP6214182.1 M36 family metallopeptidase [Pyrinomonadaceae bacterium]